MVKYHFLKEKVRSTTTKMRKPDFGQGYNSRNKSKLSRTWFRRLKTRESAITLLTSTY